MSWGNYLKQMNGKFGVTKVVKEMDTETLRRFWEFRKGMLLEEMSELMDAKTAADAVDAIVDWMVFGIGLLESMGVDSQLAWSRVHEANMAKEPGVKPERPNPWGLPDLVKPDGWVAPNHEDNVGRIGELFPPKLGEACWYCKKHTEELNFFSTEFDTLVHESCLREAAKTETDQEAQIMFRELIGKELVT